MQIPSNRWCPGSGRASVQDKRNREKAACIQCGYRFTKTSGVTPQHRPKFNERKTK